MKSIFILFKSIVIFFFIVLCIPTEVKAQNISNEGKNFWAVFPTHDPTNNQPGSLADMNIIVTARQASKVTLTCGFYSATMDIPANKAVAFAVPRNASYISATEANQPISNKGINIKVADGMPAVVVYAHVYAGTRSAATLILPYEALGQNYYSMNFTQNGVGKNFLTVVAADDNTVLKLHDKVSGLVKTIVLDKAGDVYEYLANVNEDITGSFIEVDQVTSKCKRFAAFSGSTSVNIVCSNGKDPLLQQLYDVNNWGKNYAVAPFSGRRGIIRVLAQQSNTQITINGLPYTINTAGDWHQTDILTDAVMITADKPISVAQYALSQDCAAPNGGSIASDPDMVLINPIEFSINRVTLFSASEKDIDYKYINVVIKAASKASFKINGLQPNVLWRSFAANSLYAYAQIPVSDESLSLTADDGFNAVAYGFGGNESYAYSAGTNLATTSFLKLFDSVNQRENDVICFGQPANFKITLPYQFSKLIWKFDDGTPQYEQTTPNPTIVQLNSQTLYEYQAPINKLYATAGKKRIIVEAILNNDLGTCFNGNASFDFEIEISPLPNAKFNSVASVCLNTEVFFNNESTITNGKIITNYQWDFGDGTTSTQASPKHKYLAAGTYTVKFWVKSEDGCVSEVVEQDIIVYPAITTQFVTEGLFNSNQAIKFIEHSASTSPIVSVNWNFGDGSNATGNNIEHTFKTKGVYKVALSVVNGQGCTATYNQEITILKFPKTNLDELPVPNSFTPNGDGVNDVWNIKGIEEFTDVVVEIYDRYGKRVFKSLGYQIPFDGTLNQKNLPVGVYYYMITSETDKQILKGSLTIFR